jgi:ABC-2 type transport system permease protein
MGPLAALVKKELWESFGDRTARRGGIVQAAVLVIGLGFVGPNTKVSTWPSDDPLSVLLFAFIPGVAAASMAADAFAGERERRTLETLLATPVDESVLLLGKALASIVFGTAVGALGLVLAVVTVRGLTGSPFFPTAHEIVGAIGATVGSSAIMAAAAIVVSMLVPVARATQQIISVGSMIVYALLAVLWAVLGLEVTWKNLYLGEGVMLLLGLCTLGLARVIFRRERFFEG